MMCGEHGKRATRAAKKRALEEDVPMVTYNPHAQSKSGSTKSAIVIRTRDYNLLEDQVGHPRLSLPRDQT